MTGSDKGGDPASPRRAVADLFNAALTLEEDHIDEGYEEGLRQGRRAGAAEGRALGLRKGFELGGELGYYSGCAQIWRQLQAARPGFIPTRADTAVASLERLLADFPLRNPQDERLQELMDAIRGRFKAAAAMLGQQGAYQQGPGGQGSGGTGLQF